MSFLMIENQQTATGGNMGNKISWLEKVMSWRVTALVALVLVANLGHADAGRTLKDLSFAALPGGRFEVRMDFDAPPSAPAGYEIDKPARLVFDFQGVKNGLATKKFPLPFENAQSAVVLGGEDRTRLILNMSSLDVYQTRVEGSSFYIQVGSNKVAGPLTQTAGFAEKVSSEINEAGIAITDIDFRRGDAGEGKVLISLANPAVNVNVEQSGGEIKLNFIDTQLPQKLRRRLDVTDFATPVLAVSSSYDGKDTSIAIKPEGDYDYMAYQTDNLYVVSVKRLTAQQMEEKKSKFTYVGEKLSLNFQDIPVRSVLQIIADFTELNLVASDTVSGTITLRLDNVPWDQALDLVLKTKGLDKRQVGNVLMVAPAAEIASQERQSLEARKQIQELAPLHTEYIQILYANAKKLYDLFVKGGDANKNPMLSSRGSVIVDERTNSLVVTETDDKIQQFRDLIKQIDVPVRQVSIEARIVKATTDYSKSLGVRWGLAGNKSDSGGNREILGSGGTETMVSYQNAQATKGTSYTYLIPGQGDALVTNMAATSQFGATPGRFTLGLASHNIFSTLELSALQEQGRAEDVAQPRVVTQDKQKATILSGEEIPYQEASSSGATSVSFKDAVLKLEVTPNITPDGNVMLNLTVTKAQKQGETSTNVPIIAKTEVTTNVLVNNGDTVVLGGVYEDNRSTIVNKVPFFGDLPLIGRLFRQNSTFDSKSELLIFLTPRILSDPLARK